MVDENQIEHGPAIPPRVEEKAKRGVTHVGKATKDLGSAAGAMAEEYGDHVETVWDDARRRVRGFRDDSEQYVRENPRKAILIALGVGFVLGMIFRR
jgi:ElaB/YqjD/DUF883 family membrane-anchored ribosome-binding protein